MAKLITVKVDEENNAEAWWDAAHEEVGAFREVVQTLVRDSRIEVDEVERDQILSWAKRLPGWSDGPDHAQHPLIVVESA